MLYLHDMKWTYIIRNKAAASIALLTLCVLVLTSNYVDSLHTKNVKNFISTMYEDRLIAESYIIKLNSDIYQIKEITNSSGNYDREKVQMLVNDLTKNMNAYETTKFTEAEKLKASELKQTLQSIESKHHEHSRIENAQLLNALVLLNDLSSIQIEESKLIMGRSKQVFESSALSGQFAFAITIVILLVLQAMVFTSKTLNIGTSKTKPSLN